MRDFSTQTMFVLNHYAACRDESNFEKPNEFMPERWTRDEESSRIAPHPFACLPFGYGTRGCVGKCTKICFIDFRQNHSLIKIKAIPCILNVESLNHEFLSCG